MIKITKIQHYWLFEPLQHENYNYYYVRTTIDGQSGYNWFVGCEISAGNVSSLSDIPDEKILELEKRFQDMAKMINV